jgi:hypothetical protein
VKPTPRTAKPQAPTTNSLLDFNLPVKFLGDRGPVDVPFVQAVVHTPEDDFSPILRAFVAARDKGKSKSGRRCRKGHLCQVVTFRGKQSSFRASDQGSLMTGCIPLRMGLPEARLNLPQTGAP